MLHNKTTKTIKTQLLLWLNATYVFIVEKQIIFCLVHMAECRWMFVQMPNTQEFVQKT